MWWTYFLWRSSWDLQSSLTELLTKLLHQQQEVNSAQAEDSPKERNILSEKETHFWYGISLTHWDTKLNATHEQILVLLVFHEKRPKCLKSDHRAGLKWSKMYSLYALVSLLFSCSLHSDLPSDFHKFSAHFPALFQTSQTLQGTFLTILFWDLVCLSHSWSCIKTMYIAHLLRCLWYYNGLFSKIHQMEYSIFFTLIKNHSFYIYATCPYPAVKRWSNTIKSLNLHCIICRKYFTAYK